MVCEVPGRAWRCTWPSSAHLWGGQVGGQGVMIREGWDRRDAQDGPGAGGTPEVGPQCAGPDAQGRAGGSRRHSALMFDWCF